MEQKNTFRPDGSLSFKGNRCQAVDGIVEPLCNAPIYGLTPYSESQADKGKPSQKLTLAFATADVVVLGWRLEKLCNRLRDGDLLAVRALPDRYANLDQNKTFVASIKVTPIAKE